MMTDHHTNNETPKVLPTAPGANPSSFPDVSVPVIIPDMDPPKNGRGDCVDLPDGSRIAPNGAIVEEPQSSIPEVLPPNEFTPEKEDLNLLIM